MQMLMFNLLGSQSFYLFRGLKKEVSLLWSHPNVPFYHKIRMLLRNFSCIQWFGKRTIYKYSSTDNSGKLEQIF